MEQIKILFFALVSFFGIEDGRIAADKTTVTIYPKSQEIEIIQEDLFTVTLSDDDAANVIEQWNTISQWGESDIIWAAELDSFAVKKLKIVKEQGNIEPQLQFTYADEKALRAMGIWYNAEKNQFSINHVPQNNIKTESGTLEGNYWVFNGDAPFSFTLEPFLDMPEKFEARKKRLAALLLEDTKD